MVAPVIPALNDSEIERILDAAAHAGVKEASYVLLRLPLEVRDLFREWLMANYPDRYRHVFTLIRDMRGGRDYDSQWGTRMKGTGPMAWMIGQAVRDRLREARPQQAPFETDHRSLRPAQAKRPAAEFVLVLHRPGTPGRCLNNGNCSEFPVASPIALAHDPAHDSGQVRENFR